jgi:hypothetical protein
MGDWFDELDKFVSEAEPPDVASKLGISKEAAEALLSFAEEGLESCEEGDDEEEEIEGVEKEGGELDA